MADGFITVAPDSTGKSLQTFENTISGQDVHAEAVALVDSTGNAITTLPVSGPITNAELRSSPIDVNATVNPVITNINASGNLTAPDQFVSLAIEGRSGAAFSLSGVWSGSVQPEISYNNEVTYVAANFCDAFRTFGFRTIDQEFNNSSLEILGLGGATHVRIRCVTCDSGTVEVSISANASVSMGPKNHVADSDLTGTFGIGAWDGEIVLPVVVEGADIVQGGKSDTALTSDSAGTISAKLRGLVKHAYERMPSGLGQTTMAGSLPVVIASDQGTTNVNVRNFPATQPVSGTVNIGNFPATQPVSGTVNIGNLPSTQNVSGNVTAIQGGTWYVQSINSASTVNSPNASNFLATITGTVGVNSITNPVTVAQSNASNFLSTVSGTVTAVQSNASNFLATVSGTVSATQSGTNWTVDVEKLKGATIDVNSGTASTGTQRVVLATDQPQLTNKLLVTPDSNIAFDLARIQGQASVASVAGILDVTPRKRMGSSGLSPNYISGRINTSTTTTLVNATCYLSSLHMTCVNTGAAWALKVQDGQGVARVLVPNFVLNVNFSPGGGLAFGNPIMLAYDEPILCTSGINVVTAGGSAGNIDYFATYWQ